MKHFFRFFTLLVVAVMTSTVAIAGDWVIPQPKAVTPTLGGVWGNTEYYYVRNVFTGKFIAGGEAWGSQGVVADKGFRYAVVNVNPNLLDGTLPEGQYWLMSPDSKEAQNNRRWFLERWNDAQKVGDGIKCCYTDQGAYDDNGTWVITQVGDKTYRFTIPENFTAENGYEDAHFQYVPNEALGVQLDHASNAGVNGVTYGVYYDINYVELPENCLWEFVAEDAYNAYAAKKALVEKMTLAEAAGLDITEAEAILNNPEATTEQVEAATADIQERLTAADQWNNPKDITADYIVNPSPYLNSNGWETPQGAPDFSQGASNHVAEFWNKAGFSIRQTIKNLPRGVYTLKVLAYTRTDMHAVLRAGDASMEIITVPSDQINDRAGGAAWFDAGNGVNTLDFTQTEDGDIEISLTADNTTGDHWMVFRSFQLFDRSLNIEGIKDLVRKSTENWESEFIDAYYSDSYYEAIEPAIAAMDNVTTGDEALDGYAAVIQALADLRRNIELYDEVVKQLAFWGDYSNLSFPYVSESQVYESDIYGTYIGDVLPDIMDNMIEYVDNKTLTNEQAEAFLEQIETIKAESIRQMMETPTAGQDMTAAIKNPNFEGCTQKSFPDWDILDGENTNFENNSSDAVGVVEQWHGANVPEDLLVSQKITVPPGVYRLATKGWYRAGVDNADSYSKWVAADGQNIGDNEVKVSLFGSSSIAPFHNIMEHRFNEIPKDDNGADVAGFQLVTVDESTSFYAPNSVGAAAYLFAQTTPDWSVYVDFISTGEPLAIGVKGTQVGPHAWTIWDDFVLTFVSDEMTDMRPIAEKACTDAIALTRSKMLSSDAMTNLNNAVAAVRQAENKTELLNAYKQLGECIDAANQSISNYARLQNIIDKLSEAIETYRDNEQAVNDATTLLNNLNTGYSNGSIKDDAIDGIETEVNAMIVKLKTPVEKASRDNWVDYTALIVNPKYLDDTTGWTVNHSNGVQQVQTYNGKDFGVIEGWGNSTDNAALDVYQELTGLPEGVYQVSVRGLFRMEGISTDANTYNYDYAVEHDLLDKLTIAQKQNYKPYEDRAVFYGNEVFKAASRWIIYPTAEQTDLAEWLSTTTDMGTGFAEFVLIGTEGPRYFYPDTRQGFVNRSEFIPDSELGVSPELYRTRFFTLVGEDGILRIGAKNTNPQAADWFPFTDWELKYLGNGADVDDLKDQIQQDITPVEGVTAPVVVKTEIFTIDGRRTNGLVKGLNIIKTTEFGGKVTVRKVFVK